MKLLGYWRSSASYRVRIILALKGVDYSYEPVNLLRDEQSEADYRLKNPQGLVPTLITDNGAWLTQSIAIAEYLEEVYPDPPILPASPVQRARARAIAAAIACEAQPFANLRIQKYLSKDLGLDVDAKREFLNRWTGGAMRAVETMVKETAGAFCIDDTPGLADAFLVPQLYAARRFDIDVSDCPTLLAIEKNCLKLSAFAKAHPDNQPDAVKG